MTHWYAEFANLEALLSKVADTINIQDPESFRLIIEGETNLIDAAEAVLADLDETEILITGIKAKMDEFKVRKDNLERQAESLRKLLYDVADVHPDKKIKLPTASATIAKGKDKVHIVDADMIPFAFRKYPDPTPNKVDILKALQDGEEVNGCALTTSPPTLTIRRK